MSVIWRNYNSFTWDCCYKHKDAMHISNEVMQIFYLMTLISCTHTHWNYYITEYTIRIKQNVKCQYVPGWIRIRRPGPHTVILFHMVNTQTQFIQEQMPLQEGVQMFVYCIGKITFFPAESGIACKSEAEFGIRNAQRWRNLGNIYGGIRNSG